MKTISKSMRVNNKSFNSHTKADIQYVNVPYFCEQPYNPEDIPVTSVVFDNNGAWIEMDNGQSAYFDVNILWMLKSDINVVNVSTTPNLPQYVELNWAIISDGVIRLFIENQSWEDDVTISSVEIKVKKF